MLATCCLRICCPNSWMIIQALRNWWLRFCVHVEIVLEPNLADRFTLASVIIREVRCPG